MRYTPSGMPKNSASLGVLGYLIIANKQIHSYQLTVLDEYLKSLELELCDTVIANILGGKDDSVSFASSLSAFEKEDAAVQKDIYYFLVALSSVDNVIDDNESALINRIVSVSSLIEMEIEELKKSAIEDASEIRCSNNQLFEKPKQIPPIVEESFFARLLHWIVNFFRRLFGLEKNNLDEESITPEDIDYKAAIERCAETASEDFHLVRPSYSTIIHKTARCIDEIREYKLSLSLETGLSADVADIIRMFVDVLNENVLIQNRLAEESLVQKERTIPDFTISLVGRTKAGKSTLHAILTNQGTDQIGSGNQRNTRYNRVYQWNLLRLIDTPGIGSAEAEGRTDDEIAQSVLGESDVICFVIVDDSISDDVWELLDKVAALNKPIIILLNHKENITSEVKFRRYIANPLEWLTSDGESNLDGHIHRIQKHAGDHGFGSLVKVFPVFLLAALMARNDKYLEYRDLLWTSSNMDTFIEQLKKWIAFSGSIRRSQTILDEAVHIFGRSVQQIVAAQKPVLAQVESLGRQREAKIDALKNAKEQALGKISQVLDEKFSNLAQNEALIFAEEYYDKKGDVTDYWNAYLKRIGFEDDVKSAVEAELCTYQKKADDTIRELFEDFYYAIKTEFEMQSLDIPLQLDFRSITRLFGSALGVAGSIVTIILGASNPVGWILTGAGILMGLGSMLFSSKEKRRQKAIDKVYDNIKNSILEQAPEQIQKTVSEIKTQLDDNIDKTDRLFSELIDGLQKTMNLSNQLTDCYEEEIQRINKIYAWRIIQYLQGEQEVYSSEAMNELIHSVDRSQKGIITIECDSKGLRTDILEGVIADKVIII